VPRCSSTTDADPDTSQIEDRRVSGGSGPHRPGLTVGCGATELITLTPGLILGLSNGVGDAVPADDRANATSPHTTDRHPPHTHSAHHRQAPIPCATRPTVPHARVHSTVLTSHQTTLPSGTG
jgi:hypothetical protein